MCIHLKKKERKKACDDHNIWEASINIKTLNFVPPEAKKKIDPFIFPQSSCLNMAELSSLDLSI